MIDCSEPQPTSRWGAVESFLNVKLGWLFHKADIAICSIRYKSFGLPVLRTPSTKGLILHGPCAQNTVKQAPR